MATVAQHIEALLDRLRKNLGLKEDPPGSNWNFIVAWYNRNVDNIGRGPWCEMTNTWAMWTSGAKELKKGRAYTVWAAQDATKGVNGSVWTYGTKGMRAGDQVYFDWSGPGEKDWRKVDHTGTVERINGDGTFYVLEGNYGDELCRMRRDSKFVVGYVRYDWAKISQEVIFSPAIPIGAALLVPANPDTKAKVKKYQKLLEVSADGDWGPKTDARAKRLRNAARAKVGWPKKVKIGFDVEDVQAVIDTPVDGDWGPNSQDALVRWVKELQKIVGVKPDGEWGPKTDNAFLSFRKRNLNKY